MAPRVFVVNFAGHDYTSVKGYGELVILTRGFISFQTLERVQFQVVDVITTAKPTKEDWLCLSGTNIINVIAALTIFEMVGQLQLLNFDKTTSTYRELIITKEGFGDMIHLMKAPI